MPVRERVENLDRRGGSSNTQTVTPRGRRGLGGNQWSNLLGDPTRAITEGCCPGFVARSDLAACGGHYEVGENVVWRGAFV